MNLKATIFDYFDEHVTERPGAIAYLQGDTATTYSQLQDRAAQCRGILRALGVVPGDRVALVMSDGVDLAVALLAVMGLGAIAVPCATNVSPDELAHMVGSPEPCCVIVSADQWLAFASARTLLSATLDVFTMGDAGPSDLLAVTTAGPMKTSQLDPEAAAVILYTSGTTGHPKGAVHRHRDIPHIIEATGRGVYGVGPGDRIFSSAKMFFSYGFSNSFSVPLGLGATCILTSVRPTAAVIAELFARYRPTAFFSVPTIFRSLLDYRRSVGPLGTGNLRLCVSGGEKLAPQIFEEWQAATGTDILDVVGTTEVMYGFISNRPNRIKLGSAGQPIDGYDVKLVDEAGGLIEQAGRGRLFVRGASISSYYWSKSDPVRTLADGWLCTGDIFSRDEEGFYFFEGRSDDLFKSSGMWVSPAEIEVALCRHPSVLDAAVASLPSTDGSFTNTAHVVLRPGWHPGQATIEQIAEHAARILPRYKRPQEIRFIDLIPRTATGKIRRFKLREPAPVLAAAQSAQA